MARSTLARHRLTRVLRDPIEGGGNGTGGQGENGGSGGQSGSGTGEGGADGGSGGQGGTDRGFPENTPLADMTTDQQLAYHRHHSRQWQARAESRKDYDDLKAKAEKYDAIERSQMTPSDQALHDAREAARKEERAAQAPRLVRAEFRAAAAGRQINGQPVNIDDLLEDVDLTRYVNDAGDVDTDKVSARLNKLAPVGQGGAGGNGGGTGQQGGRHGAGGHRGTEGGKPDVAETRAAMEKALGRRPKRD